MLRLDYQVFLNAFFATAKNFTGQVRLNIEEKIWEIQFLDNKLVNIL